MSFRFQSFKNFIATEVRASGGGDGPEDVHGGFEAAGGLEWDLDAAKRVLFHIADAPAHGSRFGGGSKWDDKGGDPLGRNMTELLLALQEVQAGS